MTPSSNKITIFISVPWFSPAFKAGGPIQSIANMVNQLQGKFKFYVFTADTDFDGTELIDIERDVWTDYNPNTKVFYATDGDRSNEVCRQIESLQPDILYIVGIYNWQFNLVPLFFAAHENKILSVRGMLHPGALGQKTFKKKIFLQLFKMFGKHKAISFHATDANEKQFIENAFGENVKIKTAANYPRKMQAVVKEKSEGILKILSIALISPMKNHWLILKALSKIKQPVQYGIFGPVKDYNYWQQCLALIKELPEHIKIVIEKEVPPSTIPELLQQYDVAVYPSESENYGHSIIEALGSGLPVITSNHVPWMELENNKAGLNVELNEDAIFQGLEFFANLPPEEYKEWSRNAEVYAANAVDLVRLGGEYEILFSGGK